MPEAPRAARERLGLAAILSLDHAADLLPLDRASARAWLLERKLVRVLDGREVVRWGDVYAELEPEQTRPIVAGARRVRV